MKTAVEWLVEQILQKVQNYEDGDIETEKDPFVIEYVNKYNFNVDLTKYVEQAKEMEKEQIIYSNYNGQSVGKKLKDINIHQMATKAEQYYNETFKSE